MRESTLVLISPERDVRMARFASVVLSFACVETLVATAERDAVRGAIGSVLAPNGEWIAAIGADSKVSPELRYQPSHNVPDRVEVS